MTRTNAYLEEAKKQTKETKENTQIIIVYI